MAEEIKEVKAEEKQTNPPAPEDKTKHTGETIDYAKELEATKTRLAQAEHTIVDLKKKKKEEIPPVNNEDDGDEIDAEAIAEKAAEIAEKRAQETIDKFKMDMTEDAFEDELSRLTDDPAKQELIKLHYEKSIVKTGYSRKAIQSDLVNALILADRPRMEKTISEMKQAAISKQTQANGGASGHEIESTEATLSPDEESSVRKIAQHTGVDEKIVRAKLLENKKN